MGVKKRLVMRLRSFLSGESHPRGNLESLRLVLKDLTNVNELRRCQIWVVSLTEEYPQSVYVLRDLVRQFNMRKQNL